MASTFANVFVTLAIASAALVAAPTFAQPVEVKPFELPTFSASMYREGSGPTKDWVRYKAEQREQARKAIWVDEARAIERSGQNVVRDDDELFIYADWSGPWKPVVLRTIWGLDPGVIYVYQSFDDVGRFHVVAASMVDNEGYMMLVSAGTGLVYRINSGPPVYSPDKTRFFSAGGSGMGCIEGLNVYRSEEDKLFMEAGIDMGCDQPCTHEWSGENEVKSVCNAAPGKTGKVDYRLTYRDGAWHRTRSEITP